MAVSATGRVRRIYTHENECYIRLEGTPSSQTPKDGYFKLLMSHRNYNALYSLAVVAAVNRYMLRIRTTSTITSTQHAEVVYMVVDW